MVTLTGALVSPVASVTVRAQSQTSCRQCENEHVNPGCWREIVVPAVPVPSVPRAICAVKPSSRRAMMFQLIAFPFGSVKLNCSANDCPADTVHAAPPSHVKLVTTGAAGFPPFDIGVGVGVLVDPGTGVRVAAGVPELWVGVAVPPHCPGRIPVLLVAVLLLGLVSAG